MDDKIYYIYVLRCADNSLYTGITTDIERRFSEHTSRRSSGEKYTRSKKAVSIEALWSCASRSEASKLEYAFKKLSKIKKEEIISDHLLLNKYLAQITQEAEYNYIKKKAVSLV